MPFYWPSLLFIPSHSTVKVMPEHLTFFNHFFRAKRRVKGVMLSLQLLLPPSPGHRFNRITNYQSHPRLTSVLEKYMQTTSREEEMSSRNRKVGRAWNEVQVFSRLLAQHAHVLLEIKKILQQRHILQTFMACSLQSRKCYPDFLHSRGMSLTRILKEKRNKE